MGRFFALVAACSYLRKACSWEVKLYVTRPVRIGRRLAAVCRAGPGGPDLRHSRRVRKRESV